MICGTFVMDKVPDTRVKAVVNGFKQNQPPPTEVKQEKNADGTWKVTAIWPPCPGEIKTSHSLG